MALLPSLVLLATQAQVIHSVNEFDKAVTDFKNSQFSVGARGNADLSRAIVAYVSQHKGDRGMLEASGTKIAFGINADPVLSSEVRLVPGGSKINLTRVGDRTYVGVAELKYGDAFTAEFWLGGNKVGDDRRVEVYKIPEEMRVNESVAKGEVRPMPKQVSKIYPDTQSDWWVYKPAKPEPEGGYGLIVFQDGAGPKGYGAVCLDNMIAKGDIPPCVAIFISPSVGVSDKKSYRSRQYDVLSDEYVRYFLDEYELVGASALGVKISQDPAKRCIAGVSSGGICAWTAAWERPDKFGLVLSWVGSFTNIASGPTNKEGGHNYPALIRKVDRKPIRAFLQDGDQDLDNIHGNWFLSCEQMVAALKFNGYDYVFTPGHGFHSDVQGRSEMPDALRWLFSGKK